MHIQTIKNINIKNKRVFLRADLNIPIKNNEILQDYKLESILPTINYILNNNAKIILATHIGRPNGQYNAKLSTKILVDWFLQKNYQITFESDLKKGIQESHSKFNDILLLENLRFFNAEENGTKKEKDEFVAKLKDLSDIYINDAFGLIHRNDTSITILPQRFSLQEKAFGLLVEKETKELNKLKQDVKQPFIVIIGGNKIKTKIEILNGFLKKDINNKPQSILIGGAIAYTFLKAIGQNIGNSIIDNEDIEFAHNFLRQAKEKNINIALPIDHIVLNKTKAIEEFTSDEIGIDIGPKTINLFNNIINKAQTIFINGTMGIYTDKKSQLGTKSILTNIANSNSFKVAGGGDCIAACFMFNLENKFDFLSTGGGATLKYLVTKNPFKELPGLKYI